jgi:hypothetical protein
MAKKKKDTQNLTEEALIKELQYLINEGFIVYNPEDETYRMKSDKEIQAEIDNT